MSHSDNSSEIMSLQKKDGFLSDSSIPSSFFRASRRKFSGKTKKHVSFYGIDVKQKVSTSRGEKKGKEVNTSISRKSLNPQPAPHGEKRRVWNAVTWQPSLTAISESLRSEEWWRCSFFPHIIWSCYANASILTRWHTLFPHFDSFQVLGSL